MPAEVEVFSLSGGSEEDAWLHGRAAARAWVSGSLRADDGLDVSAEFDAQVSGRLGSSVAGDLAALEGDVSGAARAGLRLQVAAPLDAFTGAGLIARGSVEASVSGQAAVTASLSLAALASGALNAVPDEIREYARIVVDEATVRAGVWARGSFAVMAKGELISTVALFPTDNTDPGVTVALRYGYAWAFGGAWGTIINIGLDPDALLPRLGDRLSRDLTAALERNGVAVGLPDANLTSWLLEAAPRVLPATVQTLLRLGRLTAATTNADDLAAAVSDFSVTLSNEVVNFLVPRVLGVVSDLLAGSALAGLPATTYRTILDAVLDLLADGDEGEPLTGGVIAAARLLLTVAEALPADLRGDLARAVRCAVALLLVTDVGTAWPRDRLTGILPGADLTKTPRQIASSVLAAELAGFLQDHDVLPAWLADLVGGTAEVAGLLAGRSADLTLVVRFVRAIRQTLLGSPQWAAVANALPPDIGTMITAAARVLEEFCSSDLTPTAARRMREGFTACLMVLIGAPLSRMIETVADTGLRAAPAALRMLADQADTGELPLSLRYSWDQLARAVVGAGVGLPTAVLLRKVAGTVETWCDTVLPEELRFLRRSLNLTELCEQINAVGTAAALNQHRLTLLPELAQHFIAHLVASIEFAVRDSAELAAALVVGSAEIIKRTLVVSALAGFKIFEESIRLSEQVAGQLQQRADDLARQLADQAGGFLLQLRELALAARAAAVDIEKELVRSLIVIALGDAAASDVSRAVLEPLITSAINAATGGLVGAAQQAIGTFADVLEAGGESLLAVAESSQSAATGVRGVLESAWTTGPAPTISIPITIGFPNPLLPLVLPDIQVEVFRVTLPAEVVGRAILTVLLDATGVGPLLTGLDTTVTSLRATRIAIDEVQARIDGQSVEQQREALAQAVTGKPLSIELVAPTPAAATDEHGEIRLRVQGANLSYVRPERAGLSRAVPRRIRVLLNGVDFTSAVTWDTPAADVLEGRLRYTSAGHTWQNPETRYTALDVFVTSPLTILVVAADGAGRESAAATMTIVPRPLPTPLVVSCVTRDALDSDRRVDEVGGTDATGRPWRLAIDDAVAVITNGRRIYVRDEIGDLVPLYVAVSKRGRGYLRVSPRRGVPKLGGLPSCSG
jgi:hypothetical protein